MRQQKSSMPFTYTVLHHWKMFSLRRQPPFLWLAFLYPRLSHYSSSVEEAKFKEIYIYIYILQMNESKSTDRDSPGSPAVKTSPSNAGGVGLILGQGAKMPHALRPKNQNIIQKQYCNKFNKDLKMVHIKTIFKNKSTDKSRTI